MLELLHLSPNPTPRLALHECDLYMDVMIYKLQLNLLIAFSLQSNLLNLTYRLLKATIKFLKISKRF